MKPNDSKLVHFIEAIKNGNLIVDEESGVIHYSNGKKANAKHKTGYLQIGVTVNRKRYIAYQHRLLYAVYYGLDSLSEELDVNHKNGIKTDNRKDNLELVTVEENQKHKFRLGLDSNLGSKNSMAILDEDVVKQIKTLLKNGVKNIDVANMFGISHKHVSLIKRGKRWKHVTV